MSKTLVLKPRMSEKAYASSKELNVYIFDVPTDSNKASVTAAIAAQFDVTVENINLLVMKGKPKRSYLKRSRPSIGSRPDFKKAYVTLKKGDNIPIFAAEEEAEKKAEEADKKADKKSKKKEKK